MEKKENFEPNSSVVADGARISTFKKEIISCNMLEVEVGTTGAMGGDSGHGSRTYFRIHNIASTDMRCRVVGHTYDFDGYKDIEFDSAGTIELIFGGDSELDTFCEALRIGYEVLGKSAGIIEEYQPSPIEMRQERFALYVNELCEHYRNSGSLKGMGEIRNKHHITGLTQQQFYECDLHKAKGYVSRDFCDKVYYFILDTTKAIPAPKYGSK